MFPKVREKNANLRQNLRQSFPCWDFGLLAHPGRIKELRRQDNGHHGQPDARRQLVTARRQLETPRVLGRDSAEWLDSDLHAAGLAIKLREIRVRIQRKGFRSIELRLWTTPLDPKEAPVGPTLLQTVGARVVLL